MSELVTVVTLAYKSSHLYETIDSVLSQTYSRIEYIISDDGTPDFDVKGVEEYIAANKRENIESVIVITAETNGGTVKNYNRALQIATGKYVVPLSGDDIFYDNNTLDLWVEEFERTGAEIITGIREVYDESMSTFIYSSPSRREIDYIKNLSPMELFEQMSVYNFVLGASTGRTLESYTKYGFYDEQYRLIEDYPMNLSLLRKGVSIHVLEKPILKYRSGGTSAFKNMDNTYFKDQDLIFEHEIEPYCKNPRKARKGYEEWKADIIYTNNYRACVAQHKSWFGKLMASITYCIRNIRFPIIKFKKLFAKILRRLR